MKCTWLFASIFYVTKCAQVAINFHFGWASTVQWSKIIEISKIWLMLHKCHLLLFCHHWAPCRCCLFLHSSFSPTDQDFWRPDKSVIATANGKAKRPTNKRRDWKFRLVTRGSTHFLKFAFLALTGTISTSGTDHLQPSYSSRFHLFITKTCSLCTWPCVKVCTDNCSWNFAHSLHVFSSVVLWQILFSGFAAPRLNVWEVPNLAKLSQTNRGTV